MKKLKLDPCHPSTKQAGTPCTHTQFQTHIHRQAHTYARKHECVHTHPRTPTRTIFGRASECKANEEMPFFLCFRQSLQFPLEEAVSVLCLVTDFSDYHEQVSEIIFHLKRTWRWDRLVLVGRIGNAYLEPQWDPGWLVPHGHDRQETVSVPVSTRELVKNDRRGIPLEPLTAFFLGTRSLPRCAKHSKNN